MGLPKTVAERNKLRQQAFPVASLTSWDVALIRATLTEHETGTFATSGLLIDHMGRDDRLSAILETLALGVVRLPVRFEAGKGGARAELARKVFEGQWTAMVPESLQLQVMRDLAMAGLSYCDLVSTPVGFRLRHWHLSHLSRDEYQNRWMVNTREGPMEVVPGDGRSVLFATADQRPWMNGAVRAVSQDWFIRQHVKNDWHNHQEVRGGGIRKAIVPEDADDADKKRFTNAIANIGAETTVECPRDQENHGWDVEFEDAKGDGSMGFERLERRCEANYAVRLLGQDMAIESPGVYVPNRAYGKIQQDRIHGYAELISTVWHNQIARPWAAYHYDDPDLAPWPRPDGEPPVDKEAAAKILTLVVTAIAKATEAGIVLDLTQLSERFGIKLAWKTAA